MCPIAAGFYSILHKLAQCDALMSPPYRIGCNEVNNAALVQPDTKALKVSAAEHKVTLKGLPSYFQPPMLAAVVNIAVPLNPFFHLVKGTMRKSQHICIREGTAHNDASIVGYCKAIPRADKLHVFGIGDSCSRAVVHAKTVKDAINNPGIAELDGIGNTHDHSQLNYIDFFLTGRERALKFPFQLGAAL